MVSPNRDQSWREEAKCRRPSVYEWVADQLKLKITEIPDIWFPIRPEKLDEQEENQNTTASGAVMARMAKCVCLGKDGEEPCPVLFECREYALGRSERIGVWGGMSEVERSGVRRNRKRVISERGMRIRRIF